MITTLESFDRALPKLASKAHILEKNRRWIHLSPLEPQTELQYLRKLKVEFHRHWSMTNLLDILEEMDMRIGLDPIWNLGPESDDRMASGL